MKMKINVKTDVPRPSFDEYFLNLAFAVSVRSDDLYIKHGATIVSKQNHILGTGYNATIRGSNLNLIPKDRDLRRPYMIHAEENAILNCMVNPLTVGGAKIYVTGLSCVPCLQRLINFGITEVYYANRAGSITESVETDIMRQNILGMSKIKMIYMDIEDA